MKKLLLAGALLCSAGLASALLLPVGNEIVLTTQEATQENLLPVSGFDDADFSQTFTSGVFNQWVTHSASSETNPITMSVVEDSERGLVASYDGRPYSWYTSVIAQRVEAQFAPGIYRLTFWAKSDNGAKAKVYLRATDASGVDVNRFFINETARPADEAQEFYGAIYNPTLTTEWAQYSVDFNLSIVSTNINRFAMTSTEAATTDDLTNFSLCFVGDNSNTGKSYLFDDVQLTLVEDLSPEEPEEPENPDLTGENILPMTEFDEADLSQTFSSGIFNEWTLAATSSEKNEITMELVDDSERGKVLSYTGNP